MTLLLAPLLGLLVGLVLGGLGAGGSVLAIPALIHGAGLSFQQAATASLFIVGAASAGGSVQHWRDGNVETRTAFAFGVSGAFGAIGGTWLGQQLSEGLLQVAFAVLVLAVAIKLFRDDDLPDPDRDAPPCKCWRVGALGLAVGLLTGVFGVGGGFVIVPVLVLVLNHPMSSAIGTSLVIISLNSVVALAARAPRLAELPWDIVLGFTAAALVGTAVGRRVADRVDSDRLTQVFAGLLVLLGLWTGFQGARLLLA